MIIQNFIDEKTFPLLQKLQHVGIYQIWCPSIRFSLYDESFTAGSFSISLGKRFLTIYSWCDGEERYQFFLEENESPQGIRRKIEGPFKGAFLEASDVVLGPISSVVRTSILRKKEDNWGYEYDAAILLKLESGQPLLFSVSETIPGLTELICNEKAIEERIKDMDIRLEW